ncbi:unnamed protein product [Auanema sp. JU1783]|nr:unnamed protein product [Auanema sp. JU1783]
MEVHKKLSLLNKMDAACDLQLGTYEERVDLLDHLERHYQPHVYESNNLLRKLLIPVMIAEYHRPKLDQWTETQNLLKHRRILGYVSAALSSFLVAGIFWVNRMN